MKRCHLPESELPLLDLGRLNDLAKQSASDYQGAQPYPHILFEDFIPTETLSEVIQAFPSPETTINWRTADAKLGQQNVQLKKMGMPYEREIAPVIRRLIWELNSGAFIRFLEALTGIDGLLPDPSLQGGGLHQTMPGGVLGIHADFTRHRTYDLDRRINVLLYLNKHWQESYGGHIELWSRDMTRCERRFAPLLGRCLIFNTDADSFHGHPDPVNCPEGETRKSIALYYYTNGRKDGHVAPTRATDWQLLPSSDKPALE